MGGPEYDILNNQQTTHNNTYTKQIHLIYIIACIDIRPESSRVLPNPGLECLLFRSGRMTV